MRTSRGAWSLAGLVAGLAGLATSYFAAMALTIRESPVVAVAELVIRLTPGRSPSTLISLVGSSTSPLLLLGILVVLGVLFAWAGRLARRTWWAPAVVYAGLGRRRRRRRRHPAAAPARSSTCPSPSASSPGWSASRC